MTEWEKFSYYILPVLSKEQLSGSVGLIVLDSFWFCLGFFPSIDLSFCFNCAFRGSISCGNEFHS